MKVLAYPLPPSHPDYPKGYRWELAVLDNHADGAVASQIPTHRWTLLDRRQAEREARRFARNFECPAALIDHDGREAVLIDRCL